MNKIIGITGRMGAGKTTLINNIKNINSEFEYLNVDNFRRNDPKLNHLVKKIYSNPIAMRRYKSILYSSLKEYLNTRTSAIIVEWALIIEDKLVDLFEKIVIVDCDEKTILERLRNGDLGIEKVKERLALQMTTLEKITQLKKADYKVVDNNCCLSDLIKYMKG